MSDQQGVIFTHDGILNEGDVALVFRKDGRIEITHNIPIVKLTGAIDAKTAPGFLMALSCYVAIEDEQQYDLNVSEAARRFASTKFPAGSSTSAH